MTADVIALPTAGLSAHIAALDDGIAALMNPMRHVYCPLFWSDDGKTATHVRFPGPCGKCGQSDGEHDISAESRAWMLAKPQR